MKDEIEVSQEELDNFKKDHTYINRAMVMEALERIASEHFSHIKRRSSAEQTIIGNMTMVLLEDLLKEVKKINTKTL
jgi:hypothetical protein